MNPQELALIGAGDCPKHGRWYGICHSCVAASERDTDQKWKADIIAERDQLLAEVKRLREALELIAEYTNYPITISIAREALKGGGSP